MDLPTGVIILERHIKPGEKVKQKISVLHMIVSNNWKTWDFSGNCKWGKKVLAGSMRIIVTYDGDLRKKNENLT
jgi:hypothetical protein